jgi:hypothetical protein
MALFFEVNQSTNQIVSLYNVPSASSILTVSECETVEATSVQADAYKQTPSGENAYLVNGTVTYQ